MRILANIVRALIILLMVIYLFSCRVTKQTEYIDRNHIEYRDRESHDSTYYLIHDSISYRNDTVFIFKDKFIIRNKIVEKNTLKIDSIYVDRNVEVFIQPTFFDKIEYYGTGVGIGFILALILYIIYILYKKYITRQ